MANVLTTLAVLGVDPKGLAGAAIYGLLGIALLVLGFKLFDWLMPHIKVEEELCKHNMPVAVVMAAAIIGISLVMVAAIASPSAEPPAQAPVVVPATGPAGL